MRSQGGEEAVVLRVVAGLMALDKASLERWSTRPALLELAANHGIYRTSLPFSIVKEWGGNE